MSAHATTGQLSAPEERPVGGTEHSWCKAVKIGTGISVVSFLLSKFPDQEALQSSIRTLQKIHPVLSCRLRFDPSRNTYYLVPSDPYVSLQCFDASATSELVPSATTIAESFHLLLEHELNRNEWDTDPTPENTKDLLFASMYAIDEHHVAVMLRLHTGVCDRSSAVTILKELGQLREGEEINGERNLNLGIEELIPSASAKKSFWARGFDVLGYSLNAFRLANLDFVDTASKMSSRVARLKLGRVETSSLLALCERSGLELWAALAAAGAVAVRSTKEIPKEQREKYGVITLVNCRGQLSPTLPANHAGFYHSAVMKSHDVSGREGVWEVARRIHASFAEAKKANKHFTDIADLNFLMNSAIDNPSLTAEGKMRTSVITVFEESVVEETEAAEGVADYMGCSSVHGIGPSIALFDTVRRGQLDCLCVYPFPLHSADQMDNLLRHINTLLVDASKSL